MARRERKPANKASNQRTAEASQKDMPRSILMVTLIATVLCIALLYGSYRLYNKIEVYDVTIQSVQEQIDGAYAESAALSQESEYIKTEEYMEQIARDRLGLVKKDELIFQKDDQ